MYIDKNFLSHNECCTRGYRWFAKRFPRGGNIQEVLDAIQENNDAVWAEWLLKKAAPQPMVFEAEALTGHHFFFAGSINVSGDINLTGCLVVGGDIRSGGTISAGLAIIAVGKIVSPQKPYSKVAFISDSNNPAPNIGIYETCRAYGVFK